MNTDKDICYKCIKLYRFIRLVLGKDISDRAIARRLGIDWRGFYNLKTGARKVPAMDLLERISGRLGIDKRFVTEAVSSDASPEEVYRMLRGDKRARDFDALGEDFPSEMRATDFERKHIAERRRTGGGADVGVAIVDSEGRFLSWDKQAERIYGWSSGEALGRSALLIYGKKRQRHFDAVLDDWREGKPWQSIEEHAKKDGRAARMQVSVTPVVGGTGGDRYYMLVLRELLSAEAIEKTKTLNSIIAKLQGTLKEQEVYDILTREMVPRQLLMRISIVAEDNRHVSLKVTSLGKMFPIEIMRKFGIDENRVAILIDKVDAYRRNVRKGETVFIPDLKVVIKQIAVASNLMPVYGAVRKFLKYDPNIAAPLRGGGKIFGTISLESPLLTEEDKPLVTAFAEQVAQVLHKARLYREQVEMAEKYHSLLQQAVEPMFVVSAANGLIEEANKEARRLSGFDQDELAGKKITELYIPGDRKPIRGMLKRLEKLRRYESDRFSLLTSKGEKVPVSLSAVMIRVAGGDVIQQVVRRRNN